MRLSRQEMVEAAEDLRTIIEARMLSVFEARRMQRLRENPDASRWAPPEVRVEADYLARLASKCIGGSPRQWQDAALAALGCRGNEEVSIEVLRDLAERARDEREGPDERRQQPEKSSPRKRGAADPASKKDDCSIRSSLGNRNRKRGSR